jgi:hypothetical protein
MADEEEIRSDEERSEDDDEPTKDDLKFVDTKDNYTGCSDEESVCSETETGSCGSSSSSSSSCEKPAKKKSKGLKVNVIVPPKHNKHEKKEVNHPALNYKVQNARRGQCCDNMCRYCVTAQNCNCMTQNCRGCSTQNCLCNPLRTMQMHHAIELISARKQNSRRNQNAKCILM